ncbi:MAG: MFS transporter, partial [Clostridia bacterium]|nr:MFS transporter [Clostridia bacterium]
RCGQRREGMYAGVNSLITKPAISFANSSFIMILGLFGFDMSVSTELQTEWAKQGILVAWMAVPAALLIICAVSLKFYPLAGKEWDDIKKEIEEKHGLPAENNQ